MKWRPEVVGEDNLEWTEYSYGEKFGYRRRSLSSAAGGEKLGCSLYEMPLGRMRGSAFPGRIHKSQVTSLCCFIASERSVTTAPATIRSEKLQVPLAGV